MLLRATACTQSGNKLDCFVTRSHGSRVQEQQPQRAAVAGRQRQGTGADGPPPPTAPASVSRSCHEESPRWRAPVQPRGCRREAGERLQRRLQGQWRPGNNRAGEGWGGAEGMSSHRVKRASTTHSCCNAPPSPYLPPAPCLGGGGHTAKRLPRQGACPLARSRQPAPPPLPPLPWARSLRITTPGERRQKEEGLWRCTSPRSMGQHGSGVRWHGVGSTSGCRPSRRRGKPTFSNAATTAATATHMHKHTPTNCQDRPQAEALNSSAPIAAWPRNVHLD